MRQAGEPRNTVGEDIFLARDGVYRGKKCQIIFVESRRARESVRAGLRSVRAREGGFPGGQRGGPVMRTLAISGESINVF